jgi:nucleotide-binding universal stress UspA family protein
MLVPLDGSPSMAAVIPALRELVGGTGALVQLLLVRPPVRVPLHEDEPILYPDDLVTQAMVGGLHPAARPARRPGQVFLDDLVAHERAEWETYLGRQGSHLAYDGVVVERELRFGDLLEETLAAVGQRGAHLIVLATRAQSAWQRILRPNLAQRLLARSPVPVLTVPPARARRRGTVLRYGRMPV